VEIRVSNSRFIATADYTPSVADARAFIAEMREEFADASHNVFAYVVGYGASVITGMSDDGEPSGTAGRPTLAVVRGSGLGDLCVVVTRYFGGTLLGTGGLVRAYGDAAKAVLSELPRAEKVEHCALRVTVSYALYEPVRLLIEERGGEIESQEFGVDVLLRVRVAVDRSDELETALIEQTGARATLTRTRSDAEPSG
jgi:uncharacterized YigZ family protein